MDDEIAKLKAEVEWLRERLYSMQYDIHISKFHHQGRFGDCPDCQAALAATAPKERNHD